ncbi:MAG TPA: phosphatidylserine decarboxylase family protein [Methanothermobacter sp.]|uniref:Putative archaetidylserine decarboxylase proenzyme n=1 Tax=Methanothermobacter tenebrarum TaxID=680118 RepID=A0ABM7YCQ2_9EURY|nr:archaetidylserine decarboxylase [Methanothermobacter tenebrarum]MDI6881980.1 archaetidylserine decarboxylase [Methanothermobacter sp.]BDH79018.1 phosphatidylserine decarboxylase proenzyme [Methanothermobacter tenebrarum]HHW16916.1 phosphatidylserine decarboxylase family protein [Methanothermobacter sp.]HOQ20351.1 archaetidylserine decarboxylase [Methanothermobacter sp.]
MFVKGVLKKLGILLTFSIILFLLGYYIITFFILSFLAFIIQFFRDPQRKTPNSKGIIVAAADGRILSGKIDRIEVIDSSYPLLDKITDDDEAILISTFMSPFDVHVNRAPITGRIIHTSYYPGKFKIAKGKILTENEKNLMVIEGEYGRVGVIQIAGFIARRIIQYVNVGERVKIGTRIGMIRFGSRVDLIIPKDCEILVDIGSKPKAGETIVARFPSTIEKEKRFIGDERI